MNPTGNPVLDGVVQIAVATLAKSPISPDAVPDFLKKVGDQLVQCIRDTEAAVAVKAPAAVAAAPKSGQSEKPPVQAASPAASPPAAEPKKTAANAAAPKAAATKAKEQPAPAVAETAAPATVAASTSASSTVSDAPKARKTPAKAEYKFASISRTPKVPVDQSVKDDAIVCLIDGEERKMLQRHLKSKYMMTEDEYRAHFDLPHDYPMTAPGYSKEKSRMAMKQGLGTPRLYENNKGATPAKMVKRKRESSKQPAAASA